MSENMLSHPTTFHDAPWYALRCTVEADVIADPYGWRTADRMVENQSAWTSHRVQLGSPYPVLGIGQPYTFSVFLRAGSRRWAALSIYDGVDNRFGWFDLTGGAKGNLSADLVSHGMVDAGGGWWRCYISYTAKIADGQVYIYLAESNGSAGFAGDPVQYPDGIGLWGAHLAHGTTMRPYFPPTWLADRFGTGYLGRRGLISWALPAPTGEYTDRFGTGCFGRRATLGVVPGGDSYAVSSYLTIGRVGTSGSLRFLEHGEPIPAVPSLAPRLRPPVVYVLDDDRRPVAVIDAYEMFEWETRWREPDEWMVRANIHACGAEELARGTYIAAPLPSGETVVGIIEGRDLEMDGTRDTEIVEVTGRCYGAFLDGRLAIMKTDAGDGYDTWNLTSGSAADAMVHYVWANCIGNDTDHPIGWRVVPNLEIGTVPATTARVQYNARFQTLAEILSDIGIATGLGWRVPYHETADRFRFEPLVGRDRSDEVLFSPTYESLERIGVSHSTRNSRSVALVAGQGEGAERARTIVYLGQNTDGGGPPFGLNVREMFVDARDIEDAGLLPERGFAKLAETPTEHAIGFDMLTGGPYDYPRDFRVGDMVRVEYNEWAHEVARVIACRQRWDETGRSVRVTVGTERPDVAHILITLARKQALSGRL